MGQPVCDATLDISPGGHAGLRLAAVCGLTLLAIAVFSVAVIGVSQSRGTLALPPTYDDVVYLLDAASRLRVLKEGGLIGFLADYTSNPPHAPLWTLLAMLGLASSAAPVSASIAAAALLLVPFAMFHWAARGLRSTWRFFYLLPCSGCRWPACWCCRFGPTRHALCSHASAR